MDAYLEQQISQWQSTIAEANRLFNVQRYGDAMRLYEKARSLATGFFGQWSDTEAAIATVVISYHNLADLYLHINLQAQALEALQQAHLFVLNALENARQQSGPDAEKDQRVAQLLQAANRTYFSIMRHQRRYPTGTDNISTVAPPSLASAHTFTLQ